MQLTIHNFFNTLFDEGQALCFAKHAKGTKVYPVSSFLSTNWANYFTINALHPSEDLNPSEEYHSADKARRADHNVVCYRNFLVEMDFCSLEEQELRIADSKMPYTTSVYSGGKSIHWIISLETPVDTAEQYRSLSERIYKALGGKLVVDTSCKNPSRLSRFPGAFRDGTEQTLIEVNSRVANEDLEQWLTGKLGQESHKSVQTPVTSTKPTNYIHTGILTGYTLHFMLMGAEKGQRNNSLFKAACDFANCGYTKEDAIRQLGRNSGLEDDEIVRTVKSAYNRVYLK